MTRVDRGKHVKTGLAGLAIAAALVFGVATINYGVSRDAMYKRQADEHSRVNAAYTDNQIRLSCFPLSSVRETECIQNEREEYRRDRREELDLVAQRMSANWARLMGGAAVLGMVLSAIGIILVWITFRATKRANEIAQDQLHASTRPIVVFDEQILRQEGDEFAAGFKFKNIGKDPAMIMECSLTRRLVNRIAAENDSAMNNHVLTARTGLPVLLCTNDRPFATHTAGISRMQIIRYRWIIEGTIKYQSAFDEKRTYETVAEFEVAYGVSSDMYGGTVYPENAIEDYRAINSYSVKGGVSQRIT